MILRIEWNDQMCYSEHHLMVPEHFYCWVAGSFNCFESSPAPDAWDIRCMRAPNKTPALAQ